MPSSLENKNLQDIQKIEVWKLWTFSEEDKKDLVRILGKKKTNELEKQRHDLYLWEKIDIDIVWKKKWFLNLSKEEKERIEKINKLLNKQYYGKEKWSFSDIGTDTFFDEWEFIFVSKLWDSRIFNFDWSKFVDTGKRFRELRRVWEYYEWVQYNPTVKNSRKIYSLINKKWWKIKSLKWELWFIKDPKPLYIDIYNKNSHTNKNKTEKYYTIYDTDMNTKIAEDVPFSFKLLFIDDWEILFKKKQWNLFDDKNFVILDVSDWIKYKYMNENEIKKHKIYIDYIYKSTLDNQKK